MGRWHPQTWNSAGAGEEDQHAASLVEGHRHFEGAGARQWQHRATLYWNLGPGGRVPRPGGRSAGGRIASRAVLLNEQDVAARFVISHRSRGDLRLRVLLPARAIPCPRGAAAYVDQLLVSFVVDHMRIGAGLAGVDSARDLGPRAAIPQPGGARKHNREQVAAFVIAGGERQGLGPGTGRLN